MTNPGLPPPLSSARREREAARVIDLRKELDEALADLDTALDGSDVEGKDIDGKATVGGQEGTVGGRDNSGAGGSACPTKVAV